MNQSNDSQEVDDYEEGPMGPRPDATLINRAMFVSGIIMLTCCLVGFYGNLMSIAVFCHSTMRAPINVILTALSIIDTILILLSIPVFILPGLNALIQNPAIQNFLEISVFLYPISMSAHTCSIYTFVLVSVERYIAVYTPLKRHKLLTCGKAKLTEAAIIFTAIVYNVVRFWEYERTPESEIRPLLRDNSDYFLYYYVLLYMFTHFLIPFSVILVLNMFVVYSLRTVAKDKLRRATRSERQQRKTTQMIVVITLIFACCTTPPFVLNLVEVITPAMFQGANATVAFIAMDVSNILVVLNSSSTFIIYLLYCRKYRILFIYYASKCFYWRSNTFRKWSDEVLVRRNTGVSCGSPAGDDKDSYTLLSADRRHVRLTISYV